MSKVSAVNVIIQAMADQMAGLLVYASTGGSLVFGTVHEIFQVCYQTTILYFSLYYRCLTYCILRKEFMTAEPGESRILQ